MSAAGNAMPEPGHEGPGYTGHKRVQRVVSRRGFLTGAGHLGILSTVGALASASALGFVAGCALDPANPANRADGEIRIGSAMFPESEIIARIWAYALEDAGYKVEVVPQIGARDVYLEALREGSVDIVPEYTGNLAAYFGDVPAGADATEVERALRANLPEGLQVLSVASAESKDAYRVTHEFSEKYRVTSLDDLAGLVGAGSAGTAAPLERIRIGGGPELAQQPFGPEGLASFYGVPTDRIEMVAYGDSGGPLTIRALADGAVDLANIYTTTPLFDPSGNPIDLMTLEDPKRMISAQNVVALARVDAIDQGAINQGAIDQRAQEVLSRVAARMTTADLVAMNQRSSGDEKAGAALIAREWLDGR